MSDLPTLTGPSENPASGEAPEQLVVLLHGLGSDGDDLIELAPYFKAILPRARFIAPNGTEECDMAPLGYQWFSLQDPSDTACIDGARRAAPILDAFIDAELEAAGLTDEELLLVGFSQGCMMALHVGLRRASPAAGIIGYSGMLIGPELLGAEISSRPPVFLSHGDADDVVPPQALNIAVEALKAEGVEVDGVMHAGLDHGIDQESVRLGMAFAAHVFDVDLPHPEPANDA